MGQYIRPSGSEAVELGHVGVRGLDVGPASLSTGSFGISSGRVAEGPDWLLCGRPRTLLSGAVSSVNIS